MHLKLVAWLVVAAALAGAGCAETDEIPAVVREAVKNVPCAPDAVITCLKQPVARGSFVYFHGETKPIVVPGDGYLVWFDENSGVRWPHMAKLVWVPSAGDRAQRVLKKGMLYPAFRVLKPNDKPMGRMVWNTL